MRVLGGSESVSFPYPLGSFLKHRDHVWHCDIFRCYSSALGWGLTQIRHDRCILFALDGHDVTWLPHMLASN